MHHTQWYAQNAIDSLPYTDTCILAIALVMWIMWNVNSGVWRSLICLSRCTMLPKWDEMELLNGSQWKWFQFFLSFSERRLTANEVTVCNRNVENSIDFLWTVVFRGEHSWTRSKSNQLRCSRRLEIFQSDEIILTCAVICVTELCDGCFNDSDGA